MRRLQFIVAILTASCVPDGLDPVDAQRPDAAGAADDAQRPTPVECLDTTYRCGICPWTTSVAAPNVSNRVGFDVDAAGRPYIAYHAARATEPSSYRIVFAYRDGDGTWQREIAEPAADLAYNEGSISLSVDDDGEAHLAYHAYEDALRFAHRDAAGTWTNETIAPDLVREAALAVDGSGGVHVSYTTLGRCMMVCYDDKGGPYCGEQCFSDLHYAYRDPADGWRSMPLVADMRRSASIGVGASGVVHIVYADSREVDEATEIRHIYRSASDGAWNDELVTVGTASPLALDASGGLHVAYASLGTLALRIAYRSPEGDWSISDAGVDGWRQRLAVDGVGGLHLCYTPHGTSRIEYTYRSPGGAMGTSTVNGSYLGVAGLAVDNDGRPHVVYLAGDPYFDFFTTPLHYAEQPPCP